MIVYVMVDGITNDLMSIGKHQRLRKQKVNDILFIVRSVTEKRSNSEHTQFFSEEKKKKIKQRRIYTKSQNNK